MNDRDKAFPVLALPPDNPRSRIGLAAVALVALAAFAIFSAPASGQGTLTTSDGMTLSLSSSGAVSALKVGSTNYVGSLPSGFFFRESVISPPNQAVNGSFESGSGTPTGWAVSGGTGGTWSIDSSNASLGSRSMKLSIPGSSPLRSPDLATTAQFPLAPNTPYRLACSMKTSGLSSSLIVYLEQQDSSGTWSQTGIGSLTGTNGWQSYAKTITTAPNIVQGYLKAYVSSGYGTAWIDDVRLSDVFGNNQPAAFGGAVTSSGGVLTQTASANGLNLSAKFTSVGSAIKVDATLTDTTGADRGIELAFRLPLDIAGWTWDKDFVTPTTIASGTHYENPDASFGNQTLGHTHSIYPFATVRNSSAAFSLAVPMGPLMDRFSYDDTHGFRVTYDLGLSTATTRNPSKATCSFWIYSNNPKWGMRSAAEKYYALNPGSFTTTATVHGAWALRNTRMLSGVANPADFGWGYEEGNNELAFDNDNGIVGLHYASSPEWDISIPGYSSRPPYSVLIAALVTALGSGGTTVDSIPTAAMAAAVVLTAPYDTGDLQQLSYNSYFWYGNRLQMYPAVPYSTLPGSTYGLRKQYSVDNPIASAASSGNTLGGIFLDNTTATFGNIENYRKSLWAYNNGPLSFSYRTGEAIQYAGDSMEDFNTALRAHLNAQGKIMMASITPGSYVWFAHTADVIGGEVAGAEVLDRAYARRTMGYGKVWTNLSVGAALPAAQVLTYLRQGLLLGYFPGFNGTYWDDSSLYERDRGVFQLYMPLIKTVAQAGWKPVNYATSSNASTLLERFGNPADGTFYLTAQNSGTSITAVTLTIDGAGLGIASTTPVTIVERLSNANRSVTRSGSNIVFSETLDPGETTAYAVTLSGGGAAPVANFSWSPANPTAGQSTQFTDTSTNTPTSWSWDFGDPGSGSGNASTAKNPTHTFSTNGSFRVKLTASNSHGSSVGEHTVTVGGGRPVAQFSWSPSNPAPGQSIQFTDLSTGTPTSWTWDFGDGRSSTVKNPTHAYSTAGSYRVKLTVRNAGGSSLGEHTVSVTGPPQAQFSWSPSSPLHGQSVQFTDLSTGVPTSWSWDFGDGGTSTAKNPTHVFSSAGSRRVKLIVSNASGSSVGEHTVTVR